MNENESTKNNSDEEIDLKKVAVVVITFAVVAGVTAGAVAGFRKVSNVRVKFYRKDKVEVVKDTE